jgi:hypothetical protein
MEMLTFYWKSVMTLGNIFLSFKVFTDKPIPYIFISFTIFWLHIIVIL